MSWLASIALAVLHTLYWLILALKSLSSRFRTGPRPLAYKRSKTPSHLAVTLLSNSAADEEATAKYFLHSLEQVTTWCQVVGIRRVTVYDREGLLADCSSAIRKRILPTVQGEDAEDSPVECDISYPITPPPSDDADSRPLSPHWRTTIPKLSVTTIRYPVVSPKAKRRASVVRTSLKRRRIPRNNEKSEEPPLNLHIVSYKSGKAGIAAAATALLSDCRHDKNIEAQNLHEPSMQALNAILEGEYGLPSPDLMIVHRYSPAGQLRSAIELGGFPPWQMRLSEMYWDPYPGTGFSWSRKHNARSIEEEEFRGALDAFANAEFRLGK